MIVDLRRKLLAFVSAVVIVLGLASCSSESAPTIERTRLATPSSDSATTTPPSADPAAAAKSSAAVRAAASRLAVAKSAAAKAKAKADRKAAEKRAKARAAAKKKAKAAAKRARERREAAERSAANQQHSCTTTSSGSCIQGGEFCRQSTYGEAGYDADGDKYICEGDSEHPHWETP